MSSLVSYRSSVVTPDTAEALRRLETSGKAHGGVRLKVKGVPRPLASWQGVREDPGPTELPAALSMRPTGREVYLSAALEDSKDPMEELAVLWALAVPLGFMPWSRYPVPGALDHVFHYPGPWSLITGFLHGEGKGEAAWPSTCAAAQISVGAWGGDRLTERAVQTHLHRLGIHCGSVDGVIAERTLASLRAMGLGGLSLEAAHSALEKLQPPRANPDPERRVGYFTIKGGNVEAFPSGKVHCVKTRAGYSVSVDGPGRMILLFGE